MAFNWGAFAGGVAQGALGLYGGSASSKAERQLARETNAIAQYEAELNRQYNERMAGVAMDFEKNMWDKSSAFSEKMASTQHQREVEDLKRAGLNPILSMGGPGASAPTMPVPSGVTASGSMPSLVKPDVAKYIQAKYANLASSAIEAYKAGKESQRIGAETETTKAMKLNQDAQTELNTATAKSRYVEVEKQKADLEAFKEEAKWRKKLAGTKAVESVVMPAVSSVAQMLGGAFLMKKIMNMNFLNSGKKVAGTFMEIPNPTR